MNDEDSGPNYTPKFKKDGKMTIASCPEFPEANGQGNSQAEAAESLSHAIEALEDDRIFDENIKKRQD